MGLDHSLVGEPSESQERSWDSKDALLYAVGVGAGLGDPLQGLEIIDRWLGERLAREPDRPGGLRVIYIERQTGPFSRAVGEVIVRHLRTAEPGLRADLARRYRVEPSGVPHGYIAEICAPQLLADAGAEIDWR